jgi:hypothetical protein
MKKVLINLTIVISNVALCYLLLFASVIVHFLFFGEGQSAAEKAPIIAVVFYLIQILGLTWLVFKKKLLTSWIVWAVCVCTAIAIFYIHVYNYV